MGKSRVTDEQLREAARTSRSMSELLRAVGLVGRGQNYSVYRRRLRELGIDAEHLHGRYRSPEPDPAVLAEVVQRSTSIQAVARELGLSLGSSGHRRVTALLALHGLDTDHFLGKASNRGRRDLPPRGRPLEEVLCRGSRIASSALRRRLLREGLLSDCCSACGGTAWQGGPMPLELDHVNGDRADNRLENLRLLCPNCHALTPTYRGRNIGRRAS